jgi:predicted phage terminase large subunit-like protein
MNKEERVDAASISIYGGRVFIPNKAQWLDGFINEVRAFPNGRHDDQVDSMSQFINWKIHQTKNVMVVTKARAR